MVINVLIRLVSFVTIRIFVEKIKNSKKKTYYTLLNQRNWKVKHNKEKRF